MTWAKFKTSYLSGLVYHFPSLCFLNLYANFFAGLRSRIDVGVIDGEEGEPHYFINVADIHL